MFIHFVRLKLYIVYTSRIVVESFLSRYVQVLSMLLSLSWIASLSYLYFITYWITRLFQNLPAKQWLPENTLKSIQRVYWLSKRSYFKQTQKHSRMYLIQPHKLLHPKTSSVRHCYPKTCFFSSPKTIEAFYILFVYMVAIEFQSLLVDLSCFKAEYKII